MIGQSLTGRIAVMIETRDAAMTEAETAVTELVQTSAPPLQPAMDDMEPLADCPPRMKGMMYATGRVVARDLVAAHMWFNIAALRGDREAAQRRQECASEMTRDEIAQALAWARAWLDSQAPVPSA